VVPAATIWPEVDHVVVGVTGVAGLAGVAGAVGVVGVDTGLPPPHAARHANRAEVTHTPAPRPENRKAIEILL